MAEAEPCSRPSGTAVPEPPLSDLFEELKRRRVIRTVVGYAAAVFVVLQVADLTFDAIGLPDWSYRFLVILSIVGFPVTAVSAWVFDLRSGTIERTPDREGGVARKAPPMVAVAVVVATVSLAGAVTWLIRGGPPAMAELDDELIAVVPFRITTPDPALAYLREGVLDLLAAKLTGTPRVVDPRTLLAAWRESAGSAEADLSEAEIVELAAGLGAGRVLLGAVVGDPSALTLTASLRDVRDDRVVAETTVPGTSDSLTSMIDGLGAQLLGAQAGVPTEQVTSSSIRAVREYLDGRALYRSGAFLEAARAYDRALDFDSTFAAAALGAVNANGMVLVPQGDRDFHRIAWENRERLAPEDQLYLQAVVGVNYPDAHAIRDQLEFRRQVAEELDGPESWYQYGDYLFHYGHVVGVQDELARAERAFRTALDQDPEFTNAALHLNWTLRMLGDPGWREVEVVEDTADVEFLLETVTLSAVTDSVQRRELLADADRRLESLSYEALVFAPFEAMSFLALDQREPEIFLLAERATVRVLEMATPAQLQDARDLRWRFLANLERWDEAGAVMQEMVEAGGSPRRTSDRWALESAVLWEGDLPDAVVEPAADRALTTWRDRGSDAWLESTWEVANACVLGLYQLSVGDVRTAREIADAVRIDGPDEAVVRRTVDGGRRSCALLLDARTTFPDDSTALRRLSDWLGIGPPSAVMRLIANLETARMWEATGDFERVWTHARRQERGPLVLTFLRPMHQLQARAAEEIGPRPGTVKLPDREGSFDWPPRGRDAP